MTYSQINHANAWGFKRWKKRKRYLDLIREGLTVGECNKKLGLTFDEGNSILWFNIKLNKYYTLNKEPARQIGEVENA